MVDLLFIAAVVVFFFLSELLARGCDRLRLRK